MWCRIHSERFLTRFSVLNVVMKSKLLTVFSKINWNDTQNMLGDVNEEFSILFMRKCLSV